MVNVEDSIQEVSKLIRSVLRGVDASGNTNSYTTYINHPDDYDSNGDLKDSSNWVDKRTYIIIGKLKKIKYGPIVIIDFVDWNDISISGQGSTSFDVSGATWHIKVDTSDSKYQERESRDRMTAEVIETLLKNNLDLYKGETFSDISLSASNVSNEDRYLGLIQVNVDFILNT